jgi:TonB family protein
MEPHASAFYLWEVAEKETSIQLSLDVVERLEREVIESFKAVTKRGSEIGGLLLGKASTAGRRAVIIEEYETVQCDYSRGPLYLLAEADKARVQSALQRRKTSPDKRLSVVGYFRSNTRKDLALDDDDLALITEYFSEPGNVFLLVKPFSMKPPMAGFFIWEGGRVQGESSHLQFPFRRSELLKGEFAKSIITGGEKVSVEEKAAAPPRTDGAPLGPTVVAREERVTAPFRREVPAPAVPIVPRPEARAPVAPAVPKREEPAAAPAAPKPEARAPATPPVPKRDELASPVAPRMEVRAPVAPAAPKPEARPAEEAAVPKREEPAPVALKPEARAPVAPVVTKREEPVSPVAAKMEARVPVPPVAPKREEPAAPAPPKAEVRVPVPPPAAKREEPTPAPPPAPKPEARAPVTPIIPKREEPAPAVTAKPEARAPVAPVAPKRQEPVAPVVAKPEARPGFQPVAAKREQPAPALFLTREGPAAVAEKEAERLVAASAGLLARLSRSRAVWALLAVIIVLAAGLSFYFWPKFQGVRGVISGAPDASSLALRVERNAGQLLLSWNREATLVKEAQRAILSILDGDHKEDVQLDLGQLRSGSIVYSPITNDVSFRLEVTNLTQGKSLSESVRVLAGRPSPAAPLGQPAPAKPSAPVGEPKPRPDAPPSTSLTKPAEPPPASSADAGAGAETPAPAAQAPRTLTPPPAPSRGESLAARIGQPANLPEPPVLEGQVSSTATRPVESPQVASPPPAVKEMPKPAAQQPATQPPAQSRTTQAPVVQPPAGAAPEPQEPLRVGGNVQEAKVVRKTTPVYPPLARQARVTGVVRLDATIGKDGRITKVQPVSGPPLLRQAAIDAVRQWVYQPTLLNGQPVEVVTQVDVSFNLNR